MSGRREISLETSLLEQVTPENEVPLGTYPEAALAVTGADSLERFTRLPDRPSSFADLDDRARQAAMQAALDGLIANGTVGLSAGTRAKAAVAAAKAGKLSVNGSLGELCRLVRGLRRYRSAIAVELKAADGRELPEMPPGVPPPGVELGYWVPFDNAKPLILLVERPDFAAGTRTFTLRTVRAEISRIADFLFCDMGGVLARGPSLRADTAMYFRTRHGFLIGARQITRSQGEDSAAARDSMTGLTAFNEIKKWQKESRLSRTQLVNVMVAQFVNTTASMLPGAPPRRI
jgi:hypothetical protein